MIVYCRSLRHSFLLASFLACGRLFFASERGLQEITSSESSNAMQDLLGILPKAGHREIQGSNMTLAMMPMPLQVSFTNDDPFLLDKDFYMELPEDDEFNERLLRAAKRFLSRLSGRTGLFFENNSPTYGKNETPSFFHWSKKLPALKIRCRRKGDEMELEEDESYSIEIASTLVVLEADTDLGILHGLETLLQLLSVDPFRQSYSWPAVSIRDKPRFRWRGLLIDASRHFMPVDVIQRNIDAMATVKLNVLHWHLTDDQGFRIESKAYPKLHERGSDGNYYKQTEIKDIVAYAAERGIRVVPEFDLPGHATAWLVGYPELGSAPGPYELSPYWGISEHVMDPTKDTLYSFLEKFLHEMTTLFPDPFVHMGGDEVKINEWNESATIQNFMVDHNLSNAHELQAYFNNRIASILKREGKIMIGWDEILHPNIPKSIIIQSWRGHDSMIQAAQQGYRSILSNGYYIDLCLSAETHYQNDPLPSAVNLTREEQELVLGGEATMWSEFVSPETIDSRIWPRTAAIAERLWSPQNVSDVKDMYRRLDIIGTQLEEHGLTHIKNYDMMLRRLVQGSDISALKTLVDVLEPVPGYERGQQLGYTSFSPLTRVVDAAPPDAPVARRFRYLVDDFLQLSSTGRADTNRTTYIEIVECLSLWKENHGKLSTSIERFPVLQEIKQLSVDLAEVAVIGLKAVERLRSMNKRIHFSNAERRALNRARKAHGQSFLAVVFDIRLLTLEKIP
ncbi:hexosaminidase [Fistulifera solaris]|uniref:beta-N-acetylhexosaminidase n=1 Tax=Fistulifera solaris TaxID=1519565 RepID=A0A1Z5JCW5_FISSO|nr:hexosaminidase [Fistulifera solaris]|eukprot:GAX11835.1 hexosaminidase [Fistulifera solaris]